MLDAPPAEEHPEDAPSGTRVPVLTRPVPDVLGGDPHPAVVLRLRDHGLEQPAVGLLDLTLTGELGLSLAQPDGESVAHALELGNSQNARPANGRDAPVDARPGEGRGKELAEPLLEQRDLAPKLVARPVLGAGIGDPLDGRAIEALSRLIN